jgi:hypothetical protein
MATEKKQKLEYEDCKIFTRIKLIGLWITLMVLYIYADIFSLYRPGYINEIIAGFMGPLTVDQFTLITSSLLMAIPALMIIACLFIKLGIIKWINIIVGIAYTLVSIGNLIGEQWIYYIIYGIIEIAITVLIVILAIKWPKKA